MSRLFYHIMQDNVGNLLFDVSGTMRIAGSGTLATIYGDEALTVILPNPMTNHPSFGSFKCFLGAGDYDFYMAKSGYTFETLTGVQGHGTMAQQDAHNVAITGGTATLAHARIESLGLGREHDPLYSLVAAFQAQCEQTLTVLGNMGLGTAPVANHRLTIVFNKTTTDGIILQPTGTDVAGPSHIAFLNTAGALVGRIICDGASTNYATTSDARLKHAIAPLTGALDVVQRLRPVTFRWKANDEPGRGFVASEVEEVVDGVITGTRDAVDAEGNIQPQQIDMSKLVPYLVSAVKELTEQVQALTARCDAAGA